MPFSFIVTDIYKAAVLLPGILFPFPIDNWDPLWFPFVGGQIEVQNNPATSQLLRSQHFLVLNLSVAGS